MLHSELPPCYLFSPSSTDSSVDDLTQLNVLVTGPTGTPYSQGLWKLSLKIPECYPKAPPKATFRTRIWHPNVLETTGSVCVDTLKKDWQPKLTLRDVLIVRCIIIFRSMHSTLICIDQTIYCLLIQPNPDSALNATAGHLLQDDYDSFARQARLMTSIHASIPSELKDKALEAKRRGDAADTTIREDAEQRPKKKGKYASSLSSVTMRKLPDCDARTQSAPSNIDQALEFEDPANEDEDGESAKENDPLSLHPIRPAPSPRRPSLAKRPLSDLPIGESEYDVTDAPCLSPSEQNVVDNVNLLADIAASESSCVNVNDRSLQETGPNDVESVGNEGRAAKRICSDSGKENTLETWEASKPFDKIVPAAIAATKVGPSAPRKASAASSSGISSVKGKSRVGLRRL